MNNHNADRFQSTHPRRMRLSGDGDLSAISDISIHASAKDATSPPTAIAVEPKDFNPRIREGCDISPRGTLQKTQYFNPRIREGCDYTGNSALRANRGFQSTHPRRMRPAVHAFVRRKLQISIHASAKDATLSSEKLVT